jgi:hypothetical protein
VASAGGPKTLPSESKGLEVVGANWHCGLLGGEVGGPASRSRVTTGVVHVVVFALLFARFLCRWGLLFLVRSLFSVGPWGSVSGVRSVYRFGFWLSFDPIYTSLHPSLIDRHLPCFRELVCEASSLDMDGDANFNRLEAPLKLSIRHFQRVF